MNKQYIGDGVYVETDGYALSITTENGIDTTNIIVLEPEAYEALVRYVDRLQRDAIPPQEYAPPTCSASEQSEFETLDEAWNALVEARIEIARLRKRLGEHDGCSRWGVRDSIALKPNMVPCVNKTTK